MSGVYWGLTAMCLVGHLEDMDEDEIVSWVLQSQHENGGFGGSPRHDSHLLYTLSALQILALYEKLHLIDTEKVISCESCTCKPAAHLQLVTACLNLFPGISYLTISCFHAMCTRSSCLSWQTRAPRLLCAF